MRNYRFSDKQVGRISLRNLPASILLLFFMVIASSCGGGSSSSTAATPDTPATVVTGGDNELRLLWTNDTHGYFMPVYHAEFEELSTYAGIAAVEGKIGGFANIKTLVDQYKPQYKNALFMDSGDTFDGSPVAQLTRGEAVIPILNAMGYDAMTPGNRDYAYGKADFLRVTDMITFPVLASNLRDAATGDLVFPAYKIFDLPTMKIAVIGLTHTFVSSGFALGTGLSTARTDTGFSLMEAELTDLTAAIRVSDDPDLIVVLSHYGWLQDRKLAGNSTGIDVILGAHTHHNIFDPLDSNTTYPTVPNADASRNVIVAQAGSMGKFLGKLDLTIDLTTNKVTDASHELVRVLDNEIVGDPVIMALAEAAYAPFKTYLDRVIGYTTAVIVRRGEVQSTMANLLTDAWASQYGTDLSRHFGIRYGYSVIPGEITVGDVWNFVSPNIGSNGMYVYTRTGQQVKNDISAGLDREYGSDPYLWPGGDTSRYNLNVKYTYNALAADGAKIVDLTIGADSLVAAGVEDATNLAKTYTYATSSGSSSAMQTNTTAVDEIIKYIEKNVYVTPRIDSRAVRLD